MAICESIQLEIRLQLPKIIIESDFQVDIHSTTGKTKEAILINNLISDITTLAKVVRIFNFPTVIGYQRNWLVPLLGGLRFVLLECGTLLLIQYIFLLLLQKV